MRHFARMLDENEETWAITVCLHDFDYERDPTGHPQNGKADPRAGRRARSIVHAIQSHGDHTGVPRVTRWRRRSTRSTSSADSSPP
jgi:predicted hydrolase (HD superfamily)